MPEQGGGYDHMSPDHADRINWWFDVPLVVLVLVLATQQFGHEAQHHDEIVHSPTTTPVTIDIEVVSAPNRLSGRATPFE